MGKPANRRRVGETEARAFASSIRISPRKLNLIAQSIRGKGAEAALAELTFSRRRIAREVKRVLESAIANAENNHQLEVDRLIVSQAFVGKALIMKRWVARARGRGARIMKPFSNLTIVVREKTEKDAAETKETA
jgi:large subunit ribosomal protein L22